MMAGEATRIKQYPRKRQKPPSGKLTNRKETTEKNLEQYLVMVIVRRKTPFTHKNTLGKMNEIAGRSKKQHENRK